MDQFINIENSIVEDQIYKGKNVIIQNLNRKLFENLLNNFEQKSKLMEGFKFYKPGAIYTINDFEKYSSKIEFLRMLDPPVEIEVLVSHYPSMTPLGLISLSSIDFSNSKAEFSLFFFRGRGSRPMYEALLWALNKIFFDLLIEKLILYVLSANNNIIKILQKNLVTQEALLKNEIENNNGVREDVIRFNLFRNEWNNSPLKLRLEKTQINTL